MDGSDHPCVVAVAGTAGSLSVSLCAYIGGLLHDTIAFVSAWVFFFFFYYGYWRSVGGSRKE